MLPSKVSPRKEKLLLSKIITKILSPARPPKQNKQSVFGVYYSEYYVMYGWKTGKINSFYYHRIAVLLCD